MMEHTAHTFVNAAKASHSTAAQTRPIRKVHFHIWRSHFSLIIIFISFFLTRRTPFVIRRRRRRRRRCNECEYRVWPLPHIHNRDHESYRHDDQPINAHTKARECLSPHSYSFVKTKNFTIPLCACRSRVDCDAKYDACMFCFHDFPHHAIVVVGTTSVARCSRSHINANHFFCFATFRMCRSMETNKQILPLHSLSALTVTRCTCHLLTYNQQPIRRDIACDRAPSNC